MSIEIVSADNFAKYFASDEETRRVFGLKTVGESTRGQIDNPATLNRIAELERQVRELRCQQNPEEKPVVTICR